MVIWRISKGLYLSLTKSRNWITGRRIYCSRSNDNSKMVESASLSNMPGRIVVSGHLVVQSFQMEFDYG